MVYLSHCSACPYTVATNLAHASYNSVHGCMICKHLHVLCYAGADPEPPIRGVLNLIFARKAREIFGHAPFYETTPT